MGDVRCEFDRLDGWNLAETHLIGRGLAVVGGAIAAAAVGSGKILALLLIALGCRLIAAGPRLGEVGELRFVLARLLAGSGECQKQKGSDKRKATDHVAISDPLLESKNRRLRRKEGHREIATYCCDKATV